MVYRWVFGPHTVHILFESALPSDTLNMSGKYDKCLRPLLQALYMLCLMHTEHISIALKHNKAFSHVMSYI
jgi:hypothetical protein